MQTTLFLFGFDIEKHFPSNIFQNFIKQESLSDRLFTVETLQLLVKIYISNLYLAAASHPVSNII